MKAKTILVIIFANVLILMASCGLKPEASREEIIGSAREYMAEDKFEEAEIVMLKALKANPSDIEMRLVLAELYQESGDHQEAVFHLKKTLELNSENIDAKLKLGNYYMQAGPVAGDHLYEEAIKLGNAIIETEPGNLDGKILLANANAGLKKLDEAVTLLNEVLEVDPDNMAALLNQGAFYMRLNQPEKAQEYYELAVAKYPQDPMSHRSIANYFAATGDIEKAEEHFRKSFDLDPEDQNTMFSLTRFFMANKEPGKVETYYKEAIELSSEPVDMSINLANFKISQGQREEGLEILNNLLAEEPEHRNLILRLAELYIEDNKKDDALAHVTKLLEIADTDAEANFLRGRISLLEGNQIQALQYFTNAVNYNPGLIQAYVAKSESEISLGHFSLAEETVLKAISINRQFVPALAQYAKALALNGNAEQAIIHADEILAQYPEFVNALIAKAEALIVLEKYSEASVIVTDLLQKHPDNIFFMHRLSVINRKAGNYTEALRNIRKLLDIDPNVTDAVNELVLVYKQMGQLQGGLAELERLAGESDVPDVYFMHKGRVYVENGDMDSAEKEFRRALEANPDNYQPYLYLGQINLGRKNFTQAVAEVDRILEQNDRFAPAHLLKGMYQYSAGNSAAAEKSYLNVLDITSEDPVASNNLAWIYADEDRNLDNALTLAESARGKDPNNPHYADTLGWVYYKMGRYILAIDQMLFSVNNGNPGPGNYYRLGMAYYKNGDETAAAQSLRKAVVSGADFKGIEEARKVLEELGG
jgi:tetratricopeptide (TPR) repeat protein